MLAILRLLAAFIADLFKSRRRLEAEILFLRHQLNIALRQRPTPLLLRGSDRALLVWMTRLWPSLLDMVQVVEPSTILRCWRTFLRNHAEAIAAIDLCVVPTVRFERLFAFIIIGHGRRQLLWFAVLA